MTDEIADRHAALLAEHQDRLERLGPALMPPPTTAPPAALRRYAAAHARRAGQVKKSCREYAQAVLAVMPAPVRPSREG